MLCISVAVQAQWQANAPANTVRLNNANLGRNVSLGGTIANHKLQVEGNALINGNLTATGRIFAPNVQFANSVISNSTLTNSVIHTLTVTGIGKVQTLHFFDGTHTNTWQPVINLTAAMTAAQTSIAGLNLLTQSYTNSLTGLDTRLISLDAGYTASFAGLNFAYSQLQAANSNLYSTLFNLQSSLNSGITFTGATFDIYTHVQAQYNGGKPLLSLSQYGEINYNSSPYMNYNNIYLTGTGNFSNSISYADTFGTLAGIGGPALSGATGGVLGTRPSWDNAQGKPALSWDANQNVKVHGTFTANDAQFTNSVIQNSVIHSLSLGGIAIDPTSLTLWQNGGFQDPNQGNVWLGQLSNVWKQKLQLHADVTEIPGWVSAWQGISVGGKHKYIAGGPDLINGMPAYGIAMHPTTGVVQVAGYSGLDLLDGNTNTPAIRIRHGKVGIGAYPTPSSEKLEVLGNVKTSGIIITNGAGTGKVLTSDANGVASWSDGNQNSFNKIYMPDNLAQRKELKFEIQDDGLLNYKRTDRSGLSYDLFKVDIEGRGTFKSNLDVGGNLNVGGYLNAGNYTKTSGLKIYPGYDCLDCPESCEQGAQDCINRGCYSGQGCVYPSEIKKGASIVLGAGYEAENINWTAKITNIPYANGAGDFVIEKKEGSTVTERFRIYNNGNVQFRGDIFDKTGNKISGTPITDYVQLTHTPNGGIGYFAISPGFHSYGVYDSQLGDLVISNFNPTGAQKGENIYMYNNAPGKKIIFGTTDAAGFTRSVAAIDGNGNVGIGTLAPVRSFHVNSPSADGGIAVFQHGSARLFIDKIANDNINFTNYKTDGSYGNIILARDGGKVVIGTRTPTTDPDYKLAVDGKIVGHDVIASAPTNWADFVFSKNYTLQSLT
ncbi:MAG: hypothetical protein NW207_11030, partial [Cytophagales bacterium]|nr:hypothetical protein [Cytophagales bacterium]